MAISKHQIYTNIVFRAHARNHRNTSNTVYAIYEMTKPPVLLRRGEQDEELFVCGGGEGLERGSCMTGLWQRVGFEDLTSLKVRVLVQETGD